MPNKLEIAYKLSKDYDKLFELLKAGKVIVGFVDYRGFSKEVICRDVCKIVRFKPYKISITARGICYASVDPWHEEEWKELDFFKEACTYANLEWIDIEEHEKVKRPTVDRIFESAKIDNEIIVTLEDGYVERFWLKGLTDEQYIQRTRLLRDHKHKETIELARRIVNDASRQDSTKIRDLDKLLNE